MTDLVNDYHAMLRHSFRKEVVSYIERCHLEDGGYFFARVPPSSGMDTYFAVKGLSILGVEPGRPRDTANFFLAQLKEGWLHNITGLFTALEVLSELGFPSDNFTHVALQRVASFRNKAGGFGATEDIDVEVPSELQDTYRAMKIFGLLGGDFGEKRVTPFVFSLLNRDGGYGRNGYSTLATTFYATAIHRMLGTDMRKLAGTRDYLRRREENWQVQFIEDLYWLILGLANLNEKPNLPDRAVSFVMMCQRSSGGFSRATIMGIPTLEYTYYALSILKEVGSLDKC